MTHPLDLLVALLQRPKLGDQLLPEVQEPASGLTLQYRHEHGQGLPDDVAAEEAKIDGRAARGAEDEGHGHGQELGLALDLELLGGGALKLAAHETAEQLQGVLVLRLWTGGFVFFSVCFGHNYLKILVIFSVVTKIYEKTLE